MDRLSRIEETVARLAALIENTAQSSFPAPAPSDPDPVGGPGLFANLSPASKSVLRPNPPFVFDGDRTQGRAFLHAVKTYVRLIPEAFLENGETSEEKAVRFAMSFMAKDSAQRWAERMAGKHPFPLSTWDAFVREFRLRFIEENEQDHALAKLESRGYYMGARDVFRYTDDFEDLVELAGFEDQLVKVTKYRTGLTPAINHAITTSSDPPSLTDYPGWRSRAYRQYEALIRARAAGGSSQPPTGVVPRPRPTTVAPVSAVAQPPRSAAPPFPPPVPMEVDRTRARVVPRRTCFRCGDPGHLARDCTTPVDIRSVDVLDEVIRQLSGELLEELAARLVTPEPAMANPEVEVPEDFLPRDE
jgi:hypothetical protein